MTMDLLARDICIKEFSAHPQEEEIKVTATQALKQNQEILFVKDEQNKIIGYCTIHDLLSGFLYEQNTLQQLMKKDFTVVHRTVSINDSIFTNASLVIVLNDKDEMVGYVTEKYYKEYLLLKEFNENKKIKQIFDATHNGILAIDVQGRISALNPAAEKMAKTTQQNAIGQPLTDIVLNQGLLKVIRSGEGHSEKYTAGKSKYLAHRTPIYEGKKLLGAVGVFQKLSEVETVSRELEVVQHLEKEIHLILEALPEGICMIDAQGNLIQKNKVFTEKYTSLLENMDQAKVFREAINKVSETKEAIDFQIDHVTVHLLPLLNDEKLLEKIICIISNHSEKFHLLQQQLKKEKLLQYFSINQNSRPIITKSKIMKQIMKEINQISQLDIPVCITGEEGVDTRELSYSIIQNSKRKDKPVIEFFCDKYDATQQREILFGISNGNKKDVIGLLECLDGGNLILHRIDQLDKECQKDFLAFLREQKSDIRIIATSSVHLENLIATDEINEELYYLLSVSNVYIPPLIKRFEDIDQLIENYVMQFEEKQQRKISITDEAKHILQQQQWEGNELELHNIVYVLCQLSPTSTVDDELVRYILSVKDLEQLNPILVRKILPLKAAVDELEKQLILKVKVTEKSYRKIAKILDVDASTIARKLKKIEEAEMEVIEQ